MDDEKTILDDEMIESQKQDSGANDIDKTDKKEEIKSKEESKKQTRKKKRPQWHRVATGFGSGIVLGGVASVLTGSLNANASNTPNTSNASTTSTTSNPSNASHISNTSGETVNEHTPSVWNDGEIPVATSVDGHMTFGEAFATARAEVGSRGVFEWRGNIYSTFTKEEWESMSVEQREEYGSHFSYESDDIYNNALNQSAHSMDDVHSEEADLTSDSSDELEVVSVDPAIQEAQTPDDELEVEAFQMGNIDVEQEIEILGVVHDEASGANIGGMAVDGQEMVLIDVNNDETFNSIGSDLSNDQELMEEELVDITDQHINVDDLEGFNNQDDMMSTSYEQNVDYVDDGQVYDT